MEFHFALYSSFEIAEYGKYILSGHVSGGYQRASTPQFGYVASYLCSI